MAQTTLTRVGLKSGTYEGLLESAGPVPIIECVHLERVIAVADVAPVGEGRHRVTVSLPSSCLSDGVQVVALRSAADGKVLDRVTLLAGSGLDGDYRAELALLREELELLKHAFRRHCAETGED